MSEQDKIQNHDTVLPENEALNQEITQAPKESRNFVWMAVISIVLTAVAWIIGSYSGTAAIIISASAIVLGALALKSHRHIIRNTAITAIIASAVLLVVIVAFFIVIYLGMKTI